MSTIIINGTRLNIGSISSNNRVEVRSGVVRVNGEVVQGGLSGTVSIVWEGPLASLEADGSVRCGDVSGSVSAEGSVECGSVGERVSAGGSVRCGKVGGKVSAGGSVHIA